MYFVWCSDNSFDGIGMPFRRDPKSGIKIFTHKIYTQRNNFKLEFLLESLANRAPPATCRIPIASFHLQIDRSKGALSPCIHLERIAASGFIVVSAFMDRLRLPPQSSPGTTRRTPAPRRHRLRLPPRQDANDFDYVQDGLESYLGGVVRCHPPGLEQRGDDCVMGYGPQAS